MTDNIEDTLVERVARAIHASTWDEPFPKPGGVEHAHALQIARAAIEAMSMPVTTLEELNKAHGEKGLAGE